MKTKVKVGYYVVLTIDIDRYVGYDNSSDKNTLKLSEIKPKILDKKSLFRVTETEVEDPEYIKTHRKYVGMISPEDLKKLIDGNFYTTIKTMGILDFFGILPAISFDDYDTQGYKMNMYVGPNLYQKQSDELMEEIAGHPNAEQIKQKIGVKLDQCLELLYNYFKYEHIGKSFLIDTKQLWLDFKEESNETSNV